MPDTSANVLLPNRFAFRFFAPVLALVRGARSYRSCPEVSDENWVVLGVRRAIEICDSGRAFIQQLLASGQNAPQGSLYFENLKSSRRCLLVTEVSERFAATLPSRDPSAWLQLPELRDFDVYAGDGHYHTAAAHDLRRGEDPKKYAVGHFFALNLRSHALSHLTVADELSRKHEHDMRALKRLTIEQLRQGAAKGRKVIYAWDKAGINFSQWHHWKLRGIYFISRQKENMRLSIIGLPPFERNDPRNAGVVADEFVATSQHVMIRRVKYRCPVTKETYVFLTNELTIPPGLIALIYRRRWDVEKTFDELKNKLHESKSWATSTQAKSMQAHFLCLAHNLMLLCEEELESQGIRNFAEEKRRKQRLAKTPASIPILIKAFQRLTVRSVKFIRWLRFQVFLSSSHEPDIASLRRFYAIL